MASSTISPATLRRLRRLSLRQLLYFVELERHRNFGRAAIALGVSQPTLSQQIGQLEEVMGVTLISRGTRRFMLTEPGEVVLVRARKALNLLADTIETIGSDQAEEPLHLGIPNYTTYPIVAEALRRFRAAHPQAIPHLIELGAEEMSQQLNDGELDAGFLSVPTPARLGAQMQSMTIWQAPTLVCLPKKHPFAALAALQPRHLAELEFVLVPRDYHRTHYDDQLASLRALGIEPRLVSTDVSNIQSQMNLTSAGLGVCLLSEKTAPIPDDLVLKRTEPELGMHTLALFWSPENRNPLLQVFRKCLREEFLATQEA